MIAVMQIGEFKDRQRQAWAEGDYRPVGQLIEPAARLLVERARVDAGQRVLDVATGSGNVAITAARTGAEVLGVDIVDAWFDHARRYAREAGVAVDLQVGDAEDLPVEDASFDVVLSSFGMIFAPRHEVVAGELARACRPGGTIAFTAWTVGSRNDDVFSAIAGHLPAPPEFVTPAIRWGDEEHVREVFARHPVTFGFERPTFPVSFASVDVFESFVLTNSGPFIAARRALEGLGRWQDARLAMRQAMEDANEADDGRYRATWEFLLAVGTKAL